MSWLLEYRLRKPNRYTTVRYHIHYIIYLIKEKKIECMYRYTKILLAIFRIFNPIKKKNFTCKDFEFNIHNISQITCIFPGLKFPNRILSIFLLFIFPKTYFPRNFLSQSLLSERYFLRIESFPNKIVLLKPLSKWVIPRKNNNSILINK